MHGLALEIEVSGANVDPAAMEALRRCSQSRRLPALIDPQQSVVNISVCSFADAAMAA